MNSLVKYLPKYYRKSEIMNNLIFSFENELKRIIEVIEHQEKQMTVLNATTALTLFENELGIKANEKEDIQTRRKRILCRRRGTQVTTVETFKKMLFPYFEEVAITELFDEYIVFASLLSRKSDKISSDEMLELQSTLSTLMPAHIKLKLGGFDWENILKLTNNTWENLRENHTWNDFLLNNE